LATVKDVPAKYTITEVSKNPHNDVAIQIKGTFESPNFLEGDGKPGSAFNYSPNDTSADRLPVLNGTMTAPFICNIAPKTLDDKSVPVHLALYGHGLLGSHEEIDYGSDVREFAQAHNILFCAYQVVGNERGRHCKLSEEPSGLVQLPNECGPNAARHVELHGARTIDARSQRVPHRPRIRWHHF